LDPRSLQRGTLDVWLQSFFWVSLITALDRIYDSRVFEASESIKVIPHKSEFQQILEHAILDRIAILSSQDIIDMI